MSSKLRGQHPAIILDNPKYSHNVGAVVRTASAFGVGQVLWTGKRVTMNVEKGERLPREERMKGYSKVQLFPTWTIRSRSSRGLLRWPLR